MGEMNLFDQKLVGQSVTQIVFIHDYVQIVFANDMTLTINNNFDFLGGNPNKFIDACVQGTLTTDAAFRMQFSDNRALTVGLADQDYFGPEAMVLTANDGSTIVWR